MPVSYKNKIYTTLGTPTSVYGSVFSVTNSSGVPAKDYTVKGETIVWNQLRTNQTSSGSGSTSTQYATVGAAETNLIYGHKYYVRFYVKYGADNTNGSSVGFKLGNFAYDEFSMSFFPTDSFVLQEHISTLNSSAGSGTNRSGFIKYSDSSKVLSIEWKNLQIFDLTQMFGAGNEPVAPSEFRAMFPDDYYPYNAGELKSIVPTSIEASGVERFQLLDKSKFTATGVFDGVTYTNNGNGTITLNGTATALTNYNLQSGISVIANHKYFCVYSNIISGSGAYPLLYTSDPAVFNTGFPMLSGDIVTALKDYDKVYFQIKVSNGKTMTNMLVKPQLFDLTQMFGAGNEPATPEEFWQKVPEKLYGHNPNDYKSVNIPSSKYFPDGMRSAGSAHDEINFLSQKAIKRIGSVDMGTLNWQYITATSHERFEAVVNGIKTVSSNTTKGNLLCSKYATHSLNDVYDHVADKIIAVATSGSNVWVYDTSYTDVAAFKAAMSGLMLYYELATPIETAITPPLQALSTYKGFTSFSAPNSLTQNGPLSVTYYAEGGTNPEKGWLTSYKRKLYMGRNIEWNQLVNYNDFQNQVITNGITFVSNGDGSIVANGTCTGDGASYHIIPWAAINPAAKFLICGCPQGGSESTYKIWDTNYQLYKDFGEGCVTGDMEAYSIWISIRPGTTVRDLVFKPQFFNLTKMFGAGNEPATPSEFWSYFDHNLYPYNAGETQPLFKISRKSYIYKEIAGYTVYFTDGVWIADTVTIFVEYADGSTETLTSQNDMGGKSRSNVVKMTFTDTDSERFVRYAMPASSGTEETLYLRPTATLVLTADANIVEIGK